MKRKEMATKIIQNEYEAKRLNLDEMQKQMAYQFRYDSDRQKMVEQILELEGYIMGLKFALSFLEA